MQVLHETHDVARASGESESKVRRLVRTGVLTASHRTSRGCVLFDDQALADAREKLDQERQERKAS